MLLSNYLLSGGVRPYLEYGWVTAPNTAGQSITANTITTLTIDTEVADTGNFGSIASNQITLAAGTYYFECYIPAHGGPSGGAGVAGVYNVTTASWITRSGKVGGDTAFAHSYLFKSQFTINTPSVFDIRLIVGVGNTVDNGQYNNTAFTLTTAGADQRTTIKLWKLA